MITVAISLTIFMTSMIVYSICRIPSRASGNFCHKSLVFDNMAEARRLEDLLAEGDVESVHRILKALQQRGDIDMIESDREIYVSGRHSVSAGKGRRITRGLLVSDYNPVEDFRNLRVTSRIHPDARTMNTMRELYGGKVEKGSAVDHGESKDHLFASDYDVCELLENLTVRSGSILAVSTPS
ncbi:MAG: hypothetical protein EG828_12515 [Deltaproteobacteria bacterium]|nr:hypothetical protein [Deltaproteobacteria bacterium]